MQTVIYDVLTISRIPFDENNVLGSSITKCGSPAIAQARTRTVQKPNIGIVLISFDTTSRLDLL
jgi:hypothetical protein